jgi:drug/metabolite transporter (DMT)-like permease
MSVRAKAYVFLLLSTILWGAAAPVIKFTLGGISPLPFLSYRFFISGVIGLGVILFHRPKMPKKLSEYGLLSIYGVLSTTIALGFLFMGLERTTVLELGILGLISPLIIVVGGGMLFHEHVTRREKIGISIAVLGALVTIIAPILLGNNEFKFSGNLLLVLFLVSDAGSVLLAKGLLRHKFSPMLMVNFAFIVGALTLIPFALISTGAASLVSEIVALPLKYHLGVWYMAIASGTLAYFFFVRGERSIEAGEASLFAYLQPLFSVPLAVFWLGENITIPFLVGAVVTAFGVYIAERRIN